MAAMRDQTDIRRNCRNALAAAARRGAPGRSTDAAGGVHPIAYRDIVRLIDRISDPQACAFWTREYPKLHQRNAPDGIAPIMIVAAIMNAAFSRHEMPEADRRLFMLYVDEFHSFTTSALAGMLSETRKYGLGITLAHQHIVQTDQVVFEAILVNAGSLIVFRVGGQDASVFRRQLLSVEVPDLVMQPNYRAFVQLMVNGERRKVFSADLLLPAD